MLLQCMFEIAETRLGEAESSEAEQQSLLQVLARRSRVCSHLEYAIQRTRTSSTADSTSVSGMRCLKLFQSTLRSRGVLILLFKPAARVHHHS